MGRWLGTLALQVRVVLCSVVLLVGACECDERTHDKTSEGVEAVAPRCGKTTWGRATIDALYAPRDADGLPWVVSPELATAPASVLGELRQRIGRVKPDDVATLSPAARVVLQNDLWGLARRLHDGGRASDPARDRLHAATMKLVSRLAVDPAKAGDAERPAALARALPAEAGWAEVGTEHSVLGHERLHGLRRLFRIWRRGEDELALASQLVALDGSGRAYLTGIVGEIERLKISETGAVDAGVHELDRRELRCHGIGAELSTVTAVAHLPATGADGFLRRFDPPVPVAELPCRECHEDDTLMSLPDPTQNIERRLDELLVQATERAGAL